MSGITSVNKNIENRKIGFQSSELVLKDDGDFALIAAIIDNEEDERVGDYQRHVFKDDEDNWNFHFCKQTVGDSCSYCENDMNRQNRFGFWAWVYIMCKKVEGTGEGWHQNKKNSYWEKEINDFRLVTFPMGRGDMYWNMFYDLYKLDGVDNVLRVSRKGKGQMDTIWSLVTTNVKVVKTEISDSSNLPSVVNYFLQQENERKNNTPVPLSGTDEDDDEESSDLASNISELF